MKNRNGDDVPVLIIGNKTDLEEKRAIPTEEGEELAKKLDCDFIETSAKLNENVKEAFELLIRKMRRRALKNNTNQVKEDKKKKKKCALF